MASPDAPSPVSVFSDDEVEDARWLAGLIKALQSNAEHQGHLEVAAALNEALDAAQAIAKGKTAH